MKKLLLIGLILAILILAMPQGVLAVTDPQVVVNAYMANTIDLTATSNVANPWLLVRGTNSPSPGVTLTPIANNPYKVVVKDSSTGGTGKMQYKGIVSGVPATLTDFFYVGALQITGSDQQILTGLPADSGTPVPYSISQYVELQDYATTGLGNEVYSITLTFTISNT
jgi:hypothetical protein